MLNLKQSLLCFTLFSVLLKLTSSEAECSFGTIDTTYVHIVGIEGSGHHAVFPLLAQMGSVTGRQVIIPSSDKHLQVAKNAQHYFNNVAGYPAYIESLRRPNHRMVYIPWESFPTYINNRKGSDAAIKNDENYDLEWYFKALLPANNTIDTRFLYISRNFTKAVATHAEFDNGFRGHARVLSHFAQIIYEEFKLTEAIDPGHWVHMRSEWLQDTTLFPLIIKQLDDFLHWCMSAEEQNAVVSWMLKHLRPERVVPISAEDYAFALHLPHAVPIEPMLLPNSSSAELD